MCSPQDFRLFIALLDKVMGANMRIHVPDLCSARSAASDVNMRKVRNVSLKASELLTRMRSPLSCWN